MNEVLNSWWFALVLIGFIVLLTFIVLIWVDKLNFSKRFKKVEPGMTGDEIRKRTKCKLKICKVDNKNGTYTAKIKSPLKFFSYNLFFIKGRYVRRERNYRKR
jgi:hypothetical protein